MAQITILDTGYPNLTNTGSQDTTMANNGSAITIKTKDVSWDRGGNTDNTPPVAKQESGSNYEAGDINFNSVENPKITVNGIIDRSSTTEMDLVPAMDKLCTTRGIKLFYYSSSTDGYRDLTDSLGATDSYHLSGTTPHLHVRVTDFKITHKSTNLYLEFSLTMEVIE